MPNTKSAAKELRKAKKRTVRNKRIKDNIKTLTKKIEKLGDKSDVKQKKELFLKLQSAIDKAVKKNVMKKNTAARKKSRISKKITAK